MGNPFSRGAWIMLLLLLCVSLAAASCMHECRLACQSRQNLDMRECEGTCKITCEERAARLIREAMDKNRFSPSNGFQNERSGAFVRYRNSQLQAGWQNGRGLEIGGFVAPGARSANRATLERMRERPWENHGKMVAETGVQVKIRW